MASKRDAVCFGRYDSAMRASRFQCVCLFGLVLPVLNGCPTCPEPFYEITTAVPAVRLPLDEAPHCFSGAEWWYYTGRLRAEGRLWFGVEAVVFHVPQFPYAPVADVWIAHYAVLDEQSGGFVYDHVSRPRPRLFDPQPERGFRVSTPLVTAEGADGRDRLQAMMGDGRYELELLLADTRDPVLHGANGYVPYGAGGMSFYYSRPRMNATGTLVVEGEPLEVSGQLWFDRQWGLDLRDPLQPWDWFSIRLDDGTDVMLFQFPGDGDPVAIGTIVPPVGETQPLAAADFRITPTATWSSPTTGATYNVAWEITIPPAEMVLSLTAVAENQELDARSTTFNVYWEGLCTVAGLAQECAVTGHAYVEQANARTLTAGPR